MCSWARTEVITIWKRSTRERRMGERIRLLIRTDIGILWWSTKKFFWRNWRGRPRRRSRKGVLIFGRGGVLLGWRLGRKFQHFIEGAASSAPTSSSRLNVTQNKKGESGMN